MKLALQKGKHEIPAIAGLVCLPIRANCNTVETPAHRKLLGQAIRSCRKKAKMTQEQLGEQANLNPKYIGEVERMEKTISVDALVRIATALNVRLRDLVHEI
jgi:ribosome-binding protein aMBF1 (putative translation factor)